MGSDTSEVRQTIYPSKLEQQYISSQVGAIVSFLVVLVVLKLLSELLI